MWDAKISRGSLGHYGESIQPPSPSWDISSGYFGPYTLPTCGIQGKSEAQVHGFPHVLVLQVANAFYKLFVLYPRLSLPRLPDSFDWDVSSRTDPEAILIRPSQTKKASSLA